MIKETQHYELWIDYISSETENSEFGMKLLVDNNFVDFLKSLKLSETVYDLFGNPTFLFDSDSAKGETFHIVAFEDDGSVAMPTMKEHLNNYEIEVCEKLFKTFYKKNKEIFTKEESEGETYYNAEELAKYFCVSLEVVVGWINEGRFSKIKKEEATDTVRISEDSIWTSPNGEREIVRIMVDKFVEENSLTEEKERKLIVERIWHFESKYGFLIEELLSKQNKTYQEEKDASEWLNLILRLDEM